MPDLSILASYAHPDDEQGIMGTMRIAIENGVRTAILVATRGEVGEISDPALATPETLGQVREQEMRDAADVVGVSQVYFLDYRDSGMDGTPENKDPRAFINADEEEAVGRIVKVMREFKPTIVVTFEETGGYGHPDHLAVCRWTTKAFSLAGDASKYPEAGPAFAPRRLYYASFPRSFRTKMIQWLKEAGDDSVFANQPADTFGLADERITNTVNVEKYLDLKRRSFGKHRTQINPNNAFSKIPREVMDEARKVEYFALVAGDPLPPAADKSDLFAGLRG